MSIPVTNLDNMSQFKDKHNLLAAAYDSDAANPAVGIDGADSDVVTSGSDIVGTLALNNGVIISHSTRALTPSDIGAAPTADPVITGSFTSPGIVDSATNTSIWIDPSDNVGIGTDIPIAQVENTGLFVTGRIVGEPAASANVAGYSFNRSGLDRGGVFLDTLDRMYLWNVLNSAIVFGQNNTEVMRINSGGNVGIGIPAPAATLHIETSTNAIESIRLSNETDTNRLRFYSDGVVQADNTSLTLNVSAPLSLIVKTSDIERMSITSAGVMIMNSARIQAFYGDAVNPGYTFNGDNNNGMFRAATDQLGFSTAGAERVRIDASGNVGIGIDNPTSELHMMGSTPQFSLQVTGDTQSSRVQFLNTLGTTRGVMKYDITDDSFQFTAAGEFSERMRIDSTGLDVTGTMSATAGLVSGGLVLTSVKTSAYTAVKYERVICNTTGGGFVLTLPLSPAAGDIVEWVDYLGTFKTNNLEIGRNGQDIENSATNLFIDIDNANTGLQYINATVGWKLV
jgi:hypothetical protein